MLNVLLSGAAALTRGPAVGMQMLAPRAALAPRAGRAPTCLIEDDNPLSMSALRQELACVPQP